VRRRQPILRHCQLNVYGELKSKSPQREAKAKYPLSHMAFHGDYAPGTMFPNRRDLPERHFLRPRTERQFAACYSVIQHSAARQQSISAPLTKVVWSIAVADGIYGA
jgi:hypothetical protein